MKRCWRSGKSAEIRTGIFLKKSKETNNTTRRRTQKHKSNNNDDPLPDEDHELYDGDGQDLKEKSDEILEEDIVEDDSADEPTEAHENPSDHSTPQVADVSNVPNHPDLNVEM